MPSELDNNLHNVNMCDDDSVLSFFTGFAFVPTKTMIYTSIQNAVFFNLVWMYCYGDDGVLSGFARRNDDDDGKWR